MYILLVTILIFSLAPCGWWIGYSIIEKKTPSVIISMVLGLALLLAIVFIAISMEG